MVSKIHCKKPPRQRQSCHERLHSATTMVLNIILLWHHPSFCGIQHKLPYEYAYSNDCTSPIFFFDIRTRVSNKCATVITLCGFSHMSSKSFVHRTHLDALGQWANKALPWKNGSSYPEMMFIFVFSIFKLVRNFFWYRLIRAILSWRTALYLLSIIVHLRASCVSGDCASLCVLCP